MAKPPAPSGAIPLGKVVDLGKLKEDKFRNDVVMMYTHYGHVWQPTVASMTAFIMDDFRKRRVLMGLIGAYGHLPENQVEGARVFLEQTQASWLFMLEYDMIFSTEDVYAILDTADEEKRPIVGGLYVTEARGDGNIPVWYVRDGDIEYQRFVGEIKMGDTLDLTACGLGFTLIHRKVFEGIAEDPEFKDDPWPYFGFDLVTLGTANGKPARVSSDIAFGRRARKAGFPVTGLALNLGHLKMRRVFPAGETTLSQ